MEVRNTGCSHETSFGNYNYGEVGNYISSLFCYECISRYKHIIQKAVFFFPSGLLPLTCNTTDILCQYLSVTNFTPLCKYGNQEKSETCLRAVNCSLGEGNPTFSIVCKVIVLCFLELWPCLYLYLEIKCGLKTCMWPSRQGVDS